MNILFINPPITNSYGEWDMSDVKSSSPPLGLLSVAAVARKLGHEVQIQDLCANPYSYYEWDMVCFTAMTINFNSALKMSTIVKSTHKNASIVIGGPHVTACSVESNMYDCFDKVFVGEGEWEFARYLDGCLDSSLDSLPFPAYDLIDFNDYDLSPFGTNKRKSAGIVTSRGCFGKCTFCSRAVFGNKFRYHSAQYVLDLMDYLNKDFGITDFLIYDDLFVGNRKRLLEICEKLLDRKYTWSCCSRVDVLDEPTLKLMKKAGCWLIEFGIESGNQAVLDLMKKNITKEQIYEAVSRTNRVGIRSKGNFIFGNFGETNETLQETIDFACRLPLNYFQHTFLAPLPGTETYQRAVDFGQFDPSWEKTSTFRINFVPKGLTKGDLIRCSKRAWRRFYLRPRIIWQEIRELNWRRLISGIKAFLKQIFRSGS